jgi:hypothetical protein
MGRKVLPCILLKSRIHYRVHMVYCQSFQTDRSLKVTQLILVAHLYKVLTGLFTTKPCDKLSGNTNISFKFGSNKSINLTVLDKLHYFCSCHDSPAACLGCCLGCFRCLGWCLQKLLRLQSHCNAAMNLVYYICTYFIFVPSSPYRRHVPTVLKNGSLKLLQSWKPFYIHASDILCTSLVLIFALCWLHI